MQMTATHIFLISMCENVLAIWPVFHKVAPSATEGRITLVIGDSTMFKMEVHVDGHDEIVEESKISISKQLG